MWKGHFVYVSTWLRLAKFCNLCVFETYSWGYGFCRQHIRIDKQISRKVWIMYFWRQNSHQLTTLINTDNWWVSLHLSNKINNNVCYWLDYNKLRLSHTHMTSIELCKVFVGLYLFCKYKICATWIMYQIHTIYNTQHMNNEFLNIGLVM